MTGTSARQRPRRLGSQAFELASQCREIVLQLRRLRTPLSFTSGSKTRIPHPRSQLRDTLLPKLISGELRIKDAEAFLKERGL
ncbi:MAG: hypothetical protein KatS3mg051_2003 [Anaerolineae bacterium]|nr:MAG: hypothetical protein KatS3mg051_2003 [Anaerolineae bacterium]